MRYRALSIAGLAITLTAASVYTRPAIANPDHVKIAGIEQIRKTPSKRIAVLDLDFSNVSAEQSYGNLYGENGPSRGISNLITNQLVKDGTYVLVERSKIDAILAEQNLGQSDRIEPTTAAQIGRLLGVDAVLMGSVTQFTVEDQSNDVSVGGFLA